MAHIQRGANIFAGMRMILPEHAERMAAPGKDPRRILPGRGAGGGGGRTPILAEEEFLESGELLELAREFHYEVAVSFRTGNGVRTVCGRVDGQAANGQVSISGCSGVVRIPWPSVIRVSRTDGGER